MSYDHRPVYVQSHPTNGFGVASFVLGLLGIVSVGFLAPIGLIFAVIGLQKQPKDLAVAGLILSILGCLELALVVMFWTMVAAAIGIGTASARSRASAPEKFIAPVERGSEVKPMSAEVSAVTSKMSATRNRQISFQLRNTSDKPISRLTIRIEMVDSNREVVAEDTLKAAAGDAIKPGTKRLLELDVPRYSPLNSHMPDTCKPRVTVVDMQ